VDVAHPVAAVLPAVDGSVLHALASATSPLSSREIHSQAGGASETAVRRVLARLVEQGVVHQLEGRPRTYVGNREHLAWPMVEALLRLPDALAAQLRQELAQWAVPVGTAALVGDVARRTGDAASEIEVLLIRSAQPAGPPDQEAWGEQLDRLRGQVTAWTGNPCRIRELADSQLDALVQSDDPVVAE